MRAVSPPVLLLVLAAALAPVPAATAAPGWPYPDAMRSRLVFLHPLVNYAFDPVWQRDWERELARSGGVRITSGSVSTDDLFTDLTVALNEPLDARFRFAYRGRWRQGLHLDTTRDEHMLGFEAALAGRASAWLQVHPAPDKEALDLAAGLLATDAARARYLRLGVRWDDPLYGDKNDRGGVSGREAVGVVWELRHAVGVWEVFSAGRYGRGHRRAFPDSAASPLVAATRRDADESVVRLRRVWGPAAFAGLELRHVRFTAAETGRGGAEGYEYADAWVHLRGLAVVPLDDRWRLRPELHWLRQWASASGRRALDHRREDVFPAVFVRRQGSGRSAWELGYMATWYRWTGDASDDGFTDKIELAWTFAFAPAARLQLSLSHERDLDRFGGGNVRFQATF